MSKLFEVVFTKHLVTETRCTIAAKNGDLDTITALIDVGGYCVEDQRRVRDERVVMKIKEIKDESQNL